MTPRHKALAAIAGLMFAGIPGTPAHAQPSPFTHSGVFVLGCTTESPSPPQESSTSDVNLYVVNNSSYTIKRYAHTTEGTRFDNDETIIGPGKSQFIVKTSNGFVQEIADSDGDCLQMFVIQSTSGFASITYS